MLWQWQRTVTLWTVIFKPQIGILTDAMLLGEDTVTSTCTYWTAPPVNHTVSTRPPRHSLFLLLFSRDSSFWVDVRSPLFTACSRSCSFPMAPPLLAYQPIDLVRLLRASCCATETCTFLRWDAPLPPADNQEIQKTNTNPLRGMERLFFFFCSLVVSRCWRFDALQQEGGGVGVTWSSRASERERKERNRSVHLSDWKPAACSHDKLLTNISRYTTRNPFFYFFFAPNQQLNLIINNYK